MICTIKKYLIITIFSYALFILYSHGSTCTQTEKQLVDTFHILNKRANIVYNQYKNKPINIPTPDGTVYSKKFEILFNDQDLFKKIQAYLADYQCIYSLDDFSKAHKKLERSTDDLKILLDNELIYNTLLCDKTEDNPLNQNLISKPLSLMKEDCPDYIPSFKERHEANSKQKDLMIIKLYNQHNKHLNIKEIMSIYNNIKNKTNINFIDLSPKEQNIVIIVDSIKGL